VSETAAANAARHDLYVHVQWKHALIPPYEGGVEEVHGWLHDDCEDERDCDHDAAAILLPPQYLYAVRRR